MVDTALSCIFPLHGLNSLSSLNENDNENVDQFNLYIDSLANIKQSMIIFGNDQLLQCSLLFQACLSLVTSKREALFIKKSQFKSLPYSVHNMPKAEKERLKLIKFRYYQDFDDIIDFFSKIHLEVNFPSIIAIDGLDSYIDLDRCPQELDKTRDFALLCAHIKDAVEYIRSKNSYCILIVSSGPIQDAHCMELYFDLVSNIKPKVKDHSYDIISKMFCKNEEISLSVLVENATVYLETFSFIQKTKFMMSSNEEAKKEQPLVNLIVHEKQINLFPKNSSGKESNETHEIKITSNNNNQLIHEKQIDSLQRHNLNDENKQTKKQIDVKPVEKNAPMFGLSRNNAILEVKNNEVENTTQSQQKITYQKEKTMNEKKLQDNNVNQANDKNESKNNSQKYSVMPNALVRDKSIQINKKSDKELLIKPDQKNSNGTDHVINIEKPEEKNDKKEIEKKLNSKKESIKSESSSSSSSSESDEDDDTVVYEPDPMRVECTKCKKLVKTFVYYKNGRCTWTLCMMLFFFGLWPFILILFLTDFSKNVVHNCPQCKSYLGVFRRPDDIDRLKRKLEKAKEEKKTKRRSRVVKLLIILMLIKEEPFKIIN